MAVTLFETHDSRDVAYGSTDGSIMRRWIAIGSADEAAVYAAVIAGTDTSWNGFVREDVRLTCLGGPSWKVEVTYGVLGLAGGSGQPLGVTPSTPSAPDDTTPLTNGWTIETGGQTVHITQSLETISSTRRGGGAAADFKQAIGRTKDGIEGTDITVPGLEWTRTVARATVLLPYLRTIKNLAGSTNNAVFYGFPIGTLLYLGASGQFNAGEGWSITHKFAHNENQADIIICDGLTVPSKKGWEYLWVAYADTIVGNEVAPLPLAAYVERVYPAKNFALLEIGV